MTRTRLTTVATSVSLALAAAGSANAAEPNRTLLNDRAHHPDAPIRLSAAQLNDRIHHRPVRPDDRGGVRGAGIESVVPASPAQAGFDWSAAGIGAVGAFGVCLLAVVGFAMVGRERRRHAAA